jgi:hypothetical protein
MDYALTGKNIETYRLLVLKQALHLYAKFKMQANRNLTPTHMLKLASAATGAAYKRGEHAHAARDIEALIASRRS